MHDWVRRSHRVLEKLNYDKSGRDAKRKSFLSSMHITTTKWFLLLDYSHTSVLLTLWISVKKKQKIGKMEEHKLASCCAFYCQCRAFSGLQWMCQDLFLQLFFTLFSGHTTQQTCRVYYPQRPLGARARLIFKAPPPHKGGSQMTTRVLRGLSRK